ncbi:hypothetical protein ACJMK2_036273 [Sinanodonta woodiana]|uniref:Aromatic-L-amino-acid decarboxylase n=1 Tax=Sinanodonta woodiana TaxID=1069815 RepID=A0ABD3WH00_SINWO
MDSEEFRRRGREMIDYVASYMENVRTYQPYPDVQPGYLRHMIPDCAPESPDSWDDLFKDIERVIMPGITHWQNPHFHAYYTTASSFPATLADILSNGIGCLGFTWGAASEATLIALLSARTKFLHKMKKDTTEMEDGVIMSKFVAYTSDQGHSSVERAGLIAAVKMRQLETDDKCALRGRTLQRAIDSDKAKGLVPIYVSEKEEIWLHIDAAYAGSAFICPEFRPILNGVEYATSFSFNPHKWMHVNFDCSTMWVKDSTLISDAFTVDPLYLKHEKQGQVMPDYRHWTIPFGRRFRSLKLWFVLRLFGQKWLQECIKKDVRLAHEFKNLVLSDERFELFCEVTLGLVCFRLKKSDEVNERLLKAINEDRRIHIVPSRTKDKYFLRFAICSSQTTSEDIQFAWKVISEMADFVLKDELVY